jgi:hypothetical protein
MWSHYADEHRGICIEFDTTVNACRKIRSVDYKRPVSIKTTELVQWKFQRSKEAYHAVLDNYFFSKSPQWRHENEWRDIRQYGEDLAPFRISAVHFGYRCDHAVQVAIVKLFADSGLRIKFYEVYPRDDSRFGRRPVDVDDLRINGVSTLALTDFQDFPNQGEKPVGKSVLQSTEPNDLER